MKLKLFLLLSAYASLSYSAQEPTNEEIIKFLDTTTTLAQTTEQIDIRFVIQKGDTDPETWQAVVTNTANYIKTCLRNDERAIAEFIPFIKVACEHIEKNNVHGNISIDFNDYQEDDPTDQSPEIAQ